MILFLIAIWILSIVSFAGYIWLLVLAFKKSTGWGLAVFFIPFVSLYFSVKFWAETKKPFLIHSGATVGLIVLAVVSAFFAVSEVKSGESKVQLSQPSVAEISEGPQRTLTQEEQMALTFMEKTIEVMEKLPSNEKQQDMLKVMRKFVKFQRTDFSAAELHEYRRDIEGVLNRRDLNKNQRKNLEKMLVTVLREEGPVVAEIGSPNDAMFSASTDSSQIETMSASLQNTAAHQKQAEAAVSRSAQPLRSADPDFAVFMPKAETPRYRRTSFIQAKNHIGAPVRFRGPRGDEKNCILVGISENGLHCRKEFASGSFSFSYEEKEIKSLKVLR